MTTEKVDELITEVKSFHNTIVFLSLVALALFLFSVGWYIAPEKYEQRRQEIRQELGLP